jgi:hypothetical protein
MTASTNEQPTVATGFPWNQAERDAGGIPTGRNKHAQQLVD